MNARHDDNQIDRQLEGAFDTPPEANFDAWHRKHSEAVSLLKQDRTVLLLKRRKLMKRTLKIAATAAVIAATWFGISQFTGTTEHNVAYAENALADISEQIKKAKTITWKRTLYNEAISKDGKEKWIETTTYHYAYRSPGLQWTGRVNDDGRLVNESVTDNVSLKKVSWNHDSKKAWVTGMAFTTEGALKRPFRWVDRQDADVFVEWIDTKTVAGRKEHMFRRTRKNVQRWYRGKRGIMDSTTDYWIGVENKQLLRYQSPGVHEFDPEKELASRRPHSNARWANISGVGNVTYDIVFDADVDDALFSMKPPEGYEVTIIERPTVTEIQMIEYLGVLVEYRNSTFPDSVSSPRAVSTEEVNQIWDKSKKDRTAIEQKLLDMKDRYMLANLNMGPFNHFIMDHTVKDTWRYIGKGIKLGDKDRIVCWYKPNGATKYRAVYGDLSVRDIAAEDLPLKVKP